MNENTILTEIIKVTNGNKEYLSDKLIREISFEIFINKQKLISIAALPKNLYELGLGFLFSEGLVFNKTEIKNIEFDETKYRINFILDIPTKRIENFIKTGEKTSGCGSTLSSAINKRNKFEFPNLKLDAKKISDLIKKFQKSSELFFQTGGVHSCALVQDYRIILFAEDIGRHNAVDKIIGMAIKENIRFDDKFLLSSGRISSEIVKKCVRLEIPAIISQSATTSEAINLAWKYKLIVIGFARASRFNIYTGLKNIVII